MPVPSIKKPKSLCYTILFLLMTFFILTNPQRSLYYALKGLHLWFEKMIPALLPFMILSGMMVRLNVTDQFASILYPFIRPVWHISKNVTYAMIMGFLCGFPMGARVTADLLERDMITEKEASYLLCFCNNIGPVYFTGFVMPLLSRTLMWPYLFGMYGLPLIYSLLLRYTCFKGLNEKPAVLQKHLNIMQELRACESQDTLSLLDQIDESVHSAMSGILMLGGYMILFNLLNLVPDVLSGFLVTATGSLFWARIPSYISPLLEITGGLGMYGKDAPLFSLIILPFGGLSCIAQTYSIIRKVNLPILPYVKHKLILTIITLFYYFLWRLLYPESFLQ